MEIDHMPVFYGNGTPTEYYLVFFFQSVSTAEAPVKKWL